MTNEQATWLFMAYFGIIGFVVGLSLPVLYQIFKPYRSSYDSDLKFWASKNKSAISKWFKNNSHAYKEKPWSVSEDWSPKNDKDNNYWNGF